MKIDTFRKEYKPLSDNQKTHMEIIKNTAALLEQAFDNAVDPNERSEKSRCMAIARTNLEQAVMWAVKGVTA